MSINIEELVTKKMNSLLPSELTAQIQLYSSDKKIEVIKKYGNEDVIDYDTINVQIEEYVNGYKYILINGLTYDEGKNPINIEEHILVKNDVNIVSYSKSIADVSYYQMLNPYLFNKDSLVAKNYAIRERFKLYIDRKKKVYLESFKDADAPKVKYENISFYDINGINANRIDLYYDVLGNGIYGKISGTNEDVNKTSKNYNTIKGMINLGYDVIEECVGTKKKDDYGLIKR